MVRLTDLRRETIMFKNKTKSIILGTFFSISLTLSFNSSASEKNRLYVGVIDANRAIELQKKTGTSGDSLIEEINTKISSFTKRKNQMRQAKRLRMALDQIAPTQNIWSAYWRAKDCP